MRDVHYDGAFANDFNQASKSWSWATWHQIRVQEEATARRLLEEVFGPAAHDGASTLESDGNGDQ